MGSYGGMAHPRGTHSGEVSRSQHRASQGIGNKPCPLGARTCLTLGKSEACQSLKMK